MYCTKCGTEIPAMVKFCPQCGEAVPGVIVTEKRGNAHVAPAAPLPGVLPAVGGRRLTKGGVAWCWVCLVINLAVAVVTLAAYSQLSYRVRDANTIVVFAIILSFLCSGGYGVLLSGRKAGFYLIVGAAAVSAVLNLVSGSFPQAFMGFLNPLITWNVIKKNWQLYT